MNNLSGRAEVIKQTDIKVYQMFVDGLLTLEQCEQLLKINIKK